MSQCVDVEFALTACPFLRGVSARQGEAAARSYASKPLHDLHRRQNGPCGNAPVLQEDYAFNSVLEMVHGPRGICPVRIAGSTWPAAQAPVLQPHTACCAAEKSQQAPRTALAAAPFASISFPLGMGGGGWPWDAFKKKRDAKQRRQNRKKPDPKARAQPTQRAPVPNNANSIPRVLQPIAALVVSKTGHLHCPPAIIALRKLVASTPVCRALRPQDLPFRIAASGVLAGLANVPCGAVRTHFEKFSPGWIVSVHLSLPFVGALRKAMMMPPYALVVTLAGAVAGQMVGARLESARMEHKAEQEAAVLRGERAAYDVPLLCATLRALRNPWDDPWTIEAGAAVETGEVFRVQNELATVQGARARRGSAAVAC